MPGKRRKKRRKFMARPEHVPPFAMSASSVVPPEEGDFLHGLLGHQDQQVSHLAQQFVGGDTDAIFPLIDRLSEIGDDAGQDGAEFLARMAINGGWWDLQDANDLPTSSLGHTTEAAFRNQIESPGPSNTRNQDYIQEYLTGGWRPKGGPSGVKEPRASAPGPHTPELVDFPRDHPSKLALSAGGSPLRFGAAGDFSLLKQHVGADVEPYDWDYSLQSGSPMGERPGESKEGLDHDLNSDIQDDANIVAGRIRRGSNSFDPRSAATIGRIGQSFGHGVEGDDESAEVEALIRAAQQGDKRALQALLDMVHQSEPQQYARKRPPAPEDGSGFRGDWHDLEDLRDPAARRAESKDRQRAIATRRRELNDHQKDAKNSRTMTPAQRAAHEAIMREAANSDTNNLRREQQRHSQIEDGPVREEKKRRRPPSPEQREASRAALAAADEQETRGIRSGGKDGTGNPLAGDLFRSADQLRREEVRSRKRKFSRQDKDLLYLSLEDGTEFDNPYPQQLKDLSSATRRGDPVAATQLLDHLLTVGFTKDSSEYRAALRIARRATRKEPQLQYSGVNAPAGGLIVRGLYYQGGKFIPGSKDMKASHDTYTEVGRRRDALKFRRQDGSYDQEAAQKYAKGEDRQPPMYSNPHPLASAPSDPKRTRDYWNDHRRKSGAGRRTDVPPGGDQADHEEPVQEAKKRAPLSPDEREDRVRRRPRTSVAPGQSSVEPKGDQSKRTRDMINDYLGQPNPAPPNDPGETPVRTDKRKYAGRFALLKGHAQQQGLLHNASNPRPAAYTRTQPRAASPHVARLLSMAQQEDDIGQLIRAYLSGQTDALPALADALGEQGLTELQNEVLGMSDNAVQSAVWTQLASSPQRDPDLHGMIGGENTAGNLGSRTRAYMNHITRGPGQPPQPQPYAKRKRRKKGDDRLGPFSRDVYDRATKGKGSLSGDLLGPGRPYGQSRLRLEGEEESAPRRKKPRPVAAGQQEMF